MEKIQKENFFVHTWKNFLKQNWVVKSSVVSLSILVLAATSVTTYFTRASEPSTITLTPTADSFVNKSEKDNNNGFDKYLKSDKDRIAYLSFNLFSFGAQQLQSAKLRIYVTNSSGTKQNLKNVVDQNWQEEKITYNNRPGRSSTVFASITDTKKGQWKEVDVTQEARSHLGKVWSFAIDNPSGSEDSMYFYSREHSSYKPQLVLQFASVPLPVTTVIPTVKAQLTVTQATSTPKVIATTTPTPTQVVIPTQGGAGASGTLPSQILNLTNWKETLPLGAPGKPIEILQPSLATYKYDPWFVVPIAGSGVRFRAPVNGVTTSGSGYPRSELREMATNGTTNASWSSTTGIHTFFIDEAVTAVPQTKKHVVAGQIHDANDDVIVIRLEYPKLFVDINGTTGPTLDDSYVLGKRFTIKFVVSGGKTNIYYNNSETPAYVLAKNYSGAYFKVGAYTQSNCTKEPASLCNSNNYGEVMVYKASVTHQ